MEKIVLLGASRGLGWQVALEFSKTVKQFVLSSRDELALNQLSKKLKDNDACAEVKVCDFTKSTALTDTLSMLEDFCPTRIFYFAGGGPFGEFESKDWKDHKWAFDVNFLFPTQLIYEVLKNQRLVNLKQIVCIGSYVAESSPDPMAASYCASKHALKGLLSSINKEEEKKIEICLFSPPYMDTKMLPPNAHPRKGKNKIISPEFAASKLVSWAMSDKKYWHYTFEKENT